jgi:hypothetical protein
MPGYAIAATDGHHARLDERGYILMPRGDTYDKIREMFASII